MAMSAKPPTESEYLVAQHENIQDVLSEVCQPWDLDLFQTKKYKKNSNAASSARKAGV